MAAFRRSHPLAFSLHDTDDQPVLAIVDDPTGNTMRLEVTNTASQTVALAAIAPGSADSHLELQFRPGVLPADNRDRITVTGPTGWSAKTISQPDTSFTVALTGPAGGQIKPDETVRFTLANVGADGRAGTRGTRVQLRYTDLSYQDETSMLTGSRVQYLSIVNRRGQKYIPLEVDFVGFNTILGDGATANSLRLRITNVSKQPIPLVPSGREAPSAFVLAFDTQPTSGPPNDWALGVPQQLKSIVVRADRWLAAPPTEQGLTLTWKLTTPTQVALGAGESILVYVDGVIGRPPSGHARLLVHYENMPGYWDGHYAVTIEKTPLVCRDIALPDGQVDARVGIGTPQPQAKLQVAGGAIVPSAGSGETAGILFPKDPGGGSGDAAWIRYYPRTGEATTLEIGTGNDADDHIALMPAAGNVGVNVIAPEGRLHIVHTNQDANGNALVLGPTGQSNLRLGYHQSYSWIQSHGSKPLSINPVGNRVGVGMSTPDGTLDVARGDGPGGTVVIRGTQRDSHFNFSTDEHTYLRGGKSTSNVYINDTGGSVAIGSSDPQGHRLYVNGPAKVLGLRVNSGYQFSRVQAGHFHAGAHTGGVKEVRIDFPERFGSTPQAVVTARSEGYYADTFAITVKYIEASHMKVDVLRLDALNAGWGQDMRLDWIAWE